jgi:hypothetical protein
MLDIAADKLSYIIAKAREFDVKVEVDDPDSGSDSADDTIPMREILEDLADDPTAQELREAIESLNEDEQLALVALVWIGRGTYEPEEWRAALADARREHVGSTADYLMGTPLLADYIEAGLEALGKSL